MIALCAAIALSTVFSSGTAVATTSAERRLHSMVNQARDSRDIDGLGLSARLSRRAHRHSARMAESGRLFHSCLSCRRDSGASTMAENVGVGDSLTGVHNALMDSSSHRANILGSGFERVGIGVVKRNGRVWVTELFAG